MAMNVEIQRALNLGALHRTLGIDSDSRISVSGIGQDGQIEIWDLATGRYFTVSGPTSAPSVEVSPAPVPDWLKQIIASPTDDLLAEYRSISPWQEGSAERRMIIFTELNFRGVSVRDTRS